MSANEVSRPPAKNRQPLEQEQRLRDPGNEPEGQGEGGDHLEGGEVEVVSRRLSLRFRFSLPGVVLFCGLSVVRLGCLGSVVPFGLFSWAKPNVV